MSIMDLLYDDGNSEAVGSGKLKSVKELSAFYDELYKKAEAILEKYDPCGPCGSYKKYCCEFCDYLSRSGCATKSLSCKLYLCDAAIERSRQCFSELVPLIKEAYKYSLVGFQATKEDVLVRHFPGYERKEKRPKSKLAFHMPRSK
jgi:hypothetical protein